MAYRSKSEIEEEIKKLSDKVFQPIENLRYDKIEEQFKTVKDHFEQAKNAAIERIKWEDDFIKKIELENEKHKANLDLVEEIDKIQENRMKQLEKEIRDIEAKKKLLEDEKKMGTRPIWDIDDEIDGQNKIKKTKEDLIAVIKEENIIVQKRLDLQYELHELETSNIKTQADAAKHGANFIGQHIQINSSLKTMSEMYKLNGDMINVASQFLKKYIAGMASMLTLLPILSKVHAETLALITTYDDQLAKLAAVTGRQAVYSDLLYSSSEAIRQYGISMSDANESLISFYKGMVDFGKESVQGQKDLVMFAAKMKQFGGSAQDTANSINLLTKTIKISSREAMDWHLRLFTLSKVIHQDIETVQRDFKATFSETAIYGQKAIDVFVKMQAGARNAGLAVSDLLSIFGHSMDTFEKTATVAGQLNTILGKDMLNSVDLLFAKDPASRMRQVLEAVEKSGKTFAQMNRWEQITVAKAAGFTDMGKAMQFFGQTLSEFDTAQEKAVEAAKKEDEFNKALLSTKNMMTVLKEAFVNLAIAVQPFMEILRAVIEILNWVLSIGNEFMSGLRDSHIALERLFGDLFQLVKIMTLVGAIALVSKLIMVGFAGATLLAFKPILITIAAVTAAIAALLAIYRAFQGWFGIGKKKTDEYTQSNENLNKTLHKTGSPQFWELPKHMAMNTELYAQSLSKTTTVVKKYSDISQELHKVQTKPGSPALWEISSVMAEGANEHTSALISNNNQLSTQSKTSEQMVKMNERLQERFESTRTYKEATNQPIVNVENIVQAFKQVQDEKKQTVMSNLSIDVNFLDIEATKRSFQAAVVKAIQEKYG